MNLNKKSDPSFDDLMLSATANYLRLSKSIIVLKSVFSVPFFFLLKVPVIVRIMHVM